MAAFRYSRRKSSVFRSGARLMTQELDFRPLFTAMDRDCNGFIDKDELRATMWDVGVHVSDKDLDMMMTVAGVPVKDRLFYEDFVRLMAGTVGRSQRKLMSRSAHNRKMSDMSLLADGEVEDKNVQTMRVAFATFDHDGDGQISTSEIHFTMTSLGMRPMAEDVNQLFKAIDKNGDGFISFEEFSEAMINYEENTDKKVFLPPPVPGLDDSEVANDRESLVHVLFDGVEVVEGNELVLSENCGNEYDPDAGDFGDDDDDDEVEYVGENQQKFMREAFKIFDKDKDGFLNERDIRYTMLHLGLDLSRDDVQAMLVVLGVKRGGKIPFDVFRNMWFGRTERSLENICLRSAMADKSLLHRPSIFAASELTEWSVPQEFQFQVDQKKHYQDLLHFVFNEFSEELNEKFRDTTQEEKKKLPVLSESQESIENKEEISEKSAKTVAFKIPGDPETGQDPSKNIYDTVADLVTTEETPIYQTISKNAPRNQNETVVDIHKTGNANIESNVRPCEPAAKRVEPVSKHVECDSKHIENVNKHVDPISKRTDPIIKPLEYVSKHIELDSQHIDPKKKSVFETPFRSAPKVLVDPPSKFSRQPFLIAPSQQPSPSIPRTDSHVDVEKEIKKSLRRQEFLDLSKMTETNFRPIKTQPFASSPTSYGARISGFSLSPVYDVPYPSPVKKAKPQPIFPEVVSDLYSTASSRKTENMPFKVNSESKITGQTTFALEGTQDSTNVKLANVFESKNESTRPFMISSSIRAYPYPVDRVSVCFTNDDSPLPAQSKMQVSQSFSSSTYTSSTASSNVKVFLSDPLEHSVAPFLTDTKKDPFASSEPLPSCTSKSILSKSKTSHTPGGTRVGLLAKERRVEYSTNAKSSYSSITGQSKTVNFQLSTEDGIKIMSCDPEEVIPEERTETQSAMCEKTLKVVHNKRVVLPTLQRSRCFGKSLGGSAGSTSGSSSFTAASSLSSEDSDKKSLASLQKDKQDPTMDNMLTLLTIRQSFTSDDKKEKESSATIIGRIEGRVSPSKHHTRPEPFSTTISSTITSSLEKSGSQFLSGLSNSPIALYQVPLNKVPTNKTALRFISSDQMTPASTVSDWHGSNAQRTTQVTTSLSPARHGKQNLLKANYLSPSGQQVSELSPIRLKKVSHYEGVLVPNTSETSAAMKGRSIITLERFKLKDETSFRPSGTFVQHERKKSKTNDKVTFRASLKLKTATLDGKDNLTLSQRVASASKTLASDKSDGKDSDSGKKVVFSRLDLSKGDDILASGVTVDTFKLNRQPSSESGMKWNAVRRMMQHMYTDQDGNRHFFFIGSLFPRKSLFNAKDYTWKAFKVFDKNLDGFVSWFELSKTFKDLGMKKTTFELCCIMDETDSNRDGMIDYFEFARMFRRTTYEFCAKRAAELYEVHSSSRHFDEDILVRTKFKYLTNKSDTPDNGWVEQLRTIFKMTDAESTGRAKLSDLGKTMMSITGGASKFVGSDLFEAGLIKDNRLVQFDGWTIESS